MNNLMFSKNEINQAIEDEQRAENEYFKGVLDFVKWITTISSAAILWIGNSLASMIGWPKTLTAIGLLFFALSIGTAIITLRQILTAWARRWKIAQEASNVLQNWNPMALQKANELDSRYGHLNSTDYFIEMTKAGETYPSAQLVIEELKQLYPMINALEDNVPYRSQKRFNNWVSFTVICLLAGLILYIIAQTVGPL